MSMHGSASGGRGPVFSRWGEGHLSGGNRRIRLATALLAIVLVILIGFGLSRGRRVAQWAPLSVVSTHEPLQELPLRVAHGEEPVEPAHTYDAVLDLRSIKRIVLGIDLDYVPKGLDHYDAVLRASGGAERFRSRIDNDYFREGRCMLRLFAKRFPAGDYTLDIEGFDPGSSDGRIVASSWFQILR
ncbi:MAG TPA: hypothetical protein VFH88_01375 [Candidatus Krumholzibacteria bacterium]|nr:hypothetical protein [Candidatus Krumholzibacteria bacterium]